MNSKPLAALGLALAGTLAAGAAHAGGRADVEWSVTIGSPRVGVVVGTPVYAPPPVVVVPRVYAPRVVAQPVVVVPPRGVYRTGYGGGWRDADRDGIPNRYDRVYNPRGDRDRDGVPNRWDRHDRNPHRR